MIPPMDEMNGMNADKRSFQPKTSVFIVAHKEEGDPFGSPSHNSPELVYFSFWTMALKPSASL